MRWPRRARARRPWRPWWLYWAGSSQLTMRHGAARWGRKGSAWHSCWCNELGRGLMVMTNLVGEETRAAATEKEAKEGLPALGALNERGRCFSKSASSGSTPLRGGCMSRVAKRREGHRRRRCSSRAGCCLRGTVAA